jgi:deoxyribodipyrimidine photolyase-related protein
MEKFYRSQRRRLGILMEGEEPVGGRWNFDTDNRQPLPRDGGSWPSPWFAPLSDEEEEIMAALPPDLPGGDGLQWWPRTREHARDQLAHALTKIAPHFGPHEDAASTSNWHLAHTRLSVAMNLGLLHPGEVVAGIVDAYDQGHLPLASAEGLLRQIIGWREWMWLLHRLRPSSYADLNFFEATEPIPASWTSMGSHDMVCLGTALGHLRDYGWMHHIERLMVLGNAATVSGLSPRDVARWMEVSFVDGAEWVMEGNVVGMAMYADHGQTATKPYIAGGNYLSRMTNFCHQCDFRPSHRTGDDACPLTTLYWDFLVRHHDRLRSNHRLAPMLSAARRRDDLAAIQSRASEARAVVIRGATSR